MAVRSVILSVLALVSAGDARAQCPDGTTPPCSAPARTTRAAAVSVPPATDRARRFLILPFRNVTRQQEQEWLVEGSTTMLSDALSRWQGISVVPDEKLYPALKRAAIKPGEIADPASVRRVAEETGGWTAVTGDVVATGGRVRVSARAWDIPTNRELIRASSEIPSTGDVRQAFDSVSLRLLRSVGLDSLGADIANTSTRDLDAYRAYVRGLAHLRRSEVRSALTAFEEATKRDSTFALAWARLADVLNNLEPATIMQPVSRLGQASALAVKHSANLPHRQRSLLLASNAMYRAQFTEARRYIDTVLKQDPNDVEALVLLTGLEQFDPLLVDVPGGRRPRGSLNSAARNAKRVTQLDPSRHQMFGVLAGIYASAGSPGVSPTLGIVREAASYPELMQEVQRRENLRFFYPLYRDSLVLIPAESLGTVAKDSLNAMRRAARGVARAWGAQWLAVASDQSAPHQLMSQLLDLDGQYAGALRELAAAESLGAPQSPAFVPAARRLLYLAKSGDLTAASRIADSLATAGFFANPTNLLYSADAAQWSFGLYLVRGRVSQAGNLLQQSIGLRKLLAPNAPGAELSGFGNLLGGSDPEAEPRLSRQFRGQTLDSIVARLDAFVASPQVGPWLPLLLPSLAEVADTTKRRHATLLPVADALAAKGHVKLAYSLAANAISDDSTLEPIAAQYAWYKTNAEAYNAAKQLVMSRFRPGTATINAQHAVFEWRVNDSTPFPRNRDVTPVGRGEYRWIVNLEGSNRYYRLTASSTTKSPVDAPSSGTLADLLPPTANRQVVAGTLSGGVKKDTTLLVGVQLRTEVAPGVLRMIVSDKAVVDALRRERPTHAVFRFEPCIVPVGTLNQRQCLEERIAITYAP
jgi:TolB-like protein/tetratricopeptide (TPR) repeat protein